MRRFACAIFAVSTLLAGGTLAVAQVPGAQSGAEGEKAPRVGSLCPDVSGKTIDGKEVRLADYQGKVVLIDFWATWCGPCRMEMPHVLAAYGRYNQMGFAVIGVSLDRNAEALQKWQAEPSTMLPWPIIYGDDKGQRLAETFGVTSIPSSFLLNRDGRIVATGLRGDELSKKVARLVDPNAPPDLAEMLAEFVRTPATERTGLADKFVEAAAKDQATANALLWPLLDKAKPDLEVAKLAVRALGPSEHSQAYTIMDSLAWAYYQTGDVARALKIQQAAYDVTGGFGGPSGTHAQMAARLAIYSFDLGQKQVALAIYPLLQNARPGYEVGTGENVLDKYIEILREKLKFAPESPAIVERTPPSGDARRE